MALRTGECGRWLEDLQYITVITISAAVSYHVCDIVPSDSGEYHCVATPWYLSASTGAWTQAGELTSTRIFLTVRFAGEESVLEFIAVRFLLNCCAEESDFILGVRIISIKDTLVWRWHFFFFFTYLGMKWKICLPCGGYFNPQLNVL